jgi:alcohol dehydrogenase YqhD (iron-dependent ADH family)
MEQFYTQIGMPTSLPQLLGRPVTEEEIAQMVEKCSRGGTITLWALQVLNQDDMAAIYRMANR